MDNRKTWLLESAATLAVLGEKVEAARDELRRLVSKGVSYDSEAMKKAYADFEMLDRQWKALERRHLAVRNEILREQYTSPPPS